MEGGESLVRLFKKQEHPLLATFTSAVVVLIRLEPMLSGL
jgi:hypothetical protein